MKQIDLDQLANNLFSFLFYLNRSLLDPAEMLKNFPVPPSHAKVVCYLFHRGTCPVSTIAKDLAIYKTNMTPILDKLIEEDYVERIPNSEDRRVIQVALTPKGQEFFLVKKAAMLENLKYKITALSQEELETLQISINNLSGILQKLYTTKGEV